MQWWLQNLTKKWQKENIPDGVKKQRDMNAQRKSVNGREEMRKKLINVLMSIKPTTYALNAVTMNFMDYSNSHCI
jgi:hypothetical protein